MYITYISIRTNFVFKSGILFHKLFTNCIVGSGFMLCTIMRYSPNYLSMNTFFKESTSNSLYCLAGEMHRNLK